MPVQQWDHVTDPLDVDKKKKKKGQITSIPETDNENDHTDLDENKLQSAITVTEPPSAKTLNYNNSQKSLKITAVDQQPEYPSQNPFGEEQEFMTLEELKANFEAQQVEANAQLSILLKSPNVPETVSSLPSIQVGGQSLRSPPEGALDLSQFSKEQLLQIQHLLNDKGPDRSSKSPSQPRFPTDMTDQNFVFGKQPEKFNDVKYTSDLEMKPPVDEQWFEQVSERVTPMATARPEMSRGSQSLMSQGLRSGRSSKKIGGIARRMQAKETTKQILEYKKFDKVSIDSESNFNQKTFNATMPKMYAPSQIQKVQSVPPQKTTNFQKQAEPTDQENPLSALQSIIRDQEAVQLRLMQKMNEPDFKFSAAYSRPQSEEKNVTSPMVRDKIPRQQTELNGPLKNPNEYEEKTYIENEELSQKQQSNIHQSLQKSKTKTHESQNKANKVSPETNESLQKAQSSRIHDFYSQTQLAQSSKIAKIVQKSQRSIRDQHRNQNTYSVEMLTGKVYDSEAADPVTETPESQIKWKANNVVIKDEEKRPEIECQTDMENGLRLKIRRSKKSFQNQVYLNDSQDVLKSRIMDQSQAKSRTIDHPVISSEVSPIISHQDHSIQVSNLSRFKSNRSNSQIKELNKTIQESHRQQQEKQEQLNRNFEMIAQLENELRMAKEYQLELEIRKRQAETIAVQTSNPELLNEVLYNPLSQNDVINSIQIFPEPKHVAVDARLRDTSTSPMIQEKATDPKMHDMSTEAWKRDGLMQTSQKSHQKIVEQPKADIHGIKTGVDGGTQYQLGGIGESIKTFDRRILSKKNTDVAEFKKSQDIVSLEGKEYLNSQVQPIQSPAVTNNENGGGTQGPVDSMPDLRQSDVSDDIPMYHDHLMQDLPTISKNPPRNDSRSTQQMFEHQFGRGKSSKKPQNNHGGNVTIINQSINQNLPAIKQSNIHLQDDMNTPKPGNIKMMSPKHPHTVEQQPNWDYPYPGQHTQRQCSVCIRRRARRQKFKELNEYPTMQDGRHFHPQDGMQHQGSFDRHSQYIAHNIQQQQPQVVETFHQRNHSLPPVINDFYQQSPQWIVSPNEQFKTSKNFDKLPAIEKPHPLKHFKGQELETYYMEQKLKPEVEKEIKRGFFEIRKKFNYPVQTARGGKFTLPNENNEEVQVYVSHVCLHSFHPIFCKLAMETVKTILQYGSIVYLKKGQVLYAPGFNDSIFYIVLFGKCKMMAENERVIGKPLNIGWTIGEEILFKVENKTIKRKEICKASVESCVLGVEKKNLTQVKKMLIERGQQDEFAKIEIVLRGNHLVKKDWK